MKKRILTLLLSAALVVSTLCGCGESRETGGSARTKKEQEKESAQENSKKDLEESRETSSEEGGETFLEENRRETCPEENGEISSEESDDLFTGALGGGEDSIELPVNVTDPNFEEGWLEYKKLQDIDWGEVWLNDDNYVKSYIAEDGTEYMYDLDGSFISNAIVQGKPSGGVEGVYYSVYDFTNESGEVDYERINARNFVAAVNVGSVPVDCLDEESYENYKNLKSEFRNEKALGKSDTTTVVYNTGEYCEFLYQNIRNSNISNLLTEWAIQNKVYNFKEIFVSTFSQVLSEGQLEDYNPSVVYALIWSYISDGRQNCEVRSVDSVNIQDFYSTEFLSICLPVYSEEELIYNICHYTIDFENGIGYYEFINAEQRDTVEQRYRQDRELTNLGLTDDIPIFKEGVLTE